MLLPISLRQWAEKSYERVALPLACAAAFVVPLKLILTYAAIFPLIVLWLLRDGFDIRSRLSRWGWLYMPFLFFTLAAIISSLFGINWARSIRAVPPLLFFPLSILAVADLATARAAIAGGAALTVASFLIAGQSVAALYSLVELGNSNKAPRLFLGAVTESGQLAISFLIALGIVIFLHGEHRCNRGASSSGGKTFSFRFVVAQSLLNTIIFTLTAFKTSIADHPELAGLLPLLAVAVIVWCTIRGLGTDKGQGNRLQWFLCTLAIPLMGAALIGNLKRGPWAGVLVGGGVLLYLFERRLLAILIASAAAALIFLTPVQNRLLQSSRDFFIAGGRSAIWEVGAELSMSFPLGIGLRNSPFLQKFSPEIPPELKHFHNNFLNVLVETGWAGLALFLWWVVSVISRPLLRKPKSVLAVSAACALLAWQVAGLVEYNFGDSEVLLVVYLALGLLGAWSDGGRDGAASARQEALY